MIDVIKTPADLLKFHQEIADRGRELMARKNSDYAGYHAAEIQGKPTDVFKNFRRHEEYGILVRLGDKLSRMESFELSGGNLKVTDESIMDTAVDVVNYAILYLGFKRSALTMQSRGQLQSKNQA